MILVNAPTAVPRPRKQRTGTTDSPRDGVILAVVGSSAGARALGLALLLADRHAHEVSVVRVAPHAEAEAAAAAIDAAAREVRAGMIVLGIESRETYGDAACAPALALLRLTDSPLLTVVPGWRRLPRRTLVLVHRGASAARLAHLAVDSLERPGTLVLAHVAREHAASDADTPTAGCRFRELRDAATQLRRIESGLQLPRGVHVERAVGRGEPTATALRLAQARNAEVIATAVPGRSTHERILLGRTAARLIRDGRRSVLAMPTLTPA